jgi:hypothetical protein
MKIKLVQCEYHRNGICGLGFHAILFDWKDGKMKRRMLATLSHEPGACAVLEVAPLSTEVGVKFGTNSWRGDDFEKELRRLVKELEK